MKENMPRSKLVEPEQVLAEFDAVDSPAVTISDITEQLPIARSTVELRFAELEEAGKIQSKRVGARAKVYWRSD